jgi:hypothetical protein
MPRVKIEISHWGPLLSWTEEVYHAFVPLYQSADRIRVMPYPDLNEGPLAEVYYQMLRSRRLMQLAGCEMPQVVILQTWVIPDAPKLPTIDELRVMAYTAILSGAETLSFFNYDPGIWNETPGFTDGFAGLMAELTTFASRYADGEAETRLNADGVLQSTINLPGHLPVNIVVNTNRSAVQGLAALAVVIDEPVTLIATSRDDCRCNTIRRFRPWRARWRRRCP